MQLLFLAMGVHLVSELAMARHSHFYSVVFLSVARFLQFPPLAAMHASNVLQFCKNFGLDCLTRNLKHTAKILYCKYCKYHLGAMFSHNHL